jgi:hypothetical protein
VKNVPWKGSKTPWGFVKPVAPESGILLLVERVRIAIVLARLCNMLLLLGLRSEGDIFLLLLCNHLAIKRLQ